MSLCIIYALKSLSKTSSYTGNKVSVMHIHASRQITFQMQRLFSHLISLNFQLWIKSIFLYLKSIPSSLFSYSSLLHHILNSKLFFFFYFQSCIQFPFICVDLFPCESFPSGKKSLELKWLLCFHKCSQVFSYNVWWTNRCSIFFFNQK